MSEYIAPLKDMQFVLRELVELDAIAALPGNEEVGAELASAILEEAGKFATGVPSPLNVVGDREGACWQDGEVRTATGWRQAYEQFCEGGWHALSCSAEFGGQGLPRVISSLVEEMWNGANVAFAVGPMVTRGAIEALELRGSPEQKAIYLPKLVSGEWAGTMNLTEPQAGSDLSSVRTRAIAKPDGSYRLHGQKIFITYGEHDLTPNIVHLVLARTPDAPEGVKGLSLFVVPKYLPNPDSSLGRRNDKRPRSSMAPTLVFDKATGELIMTAGSPGGALIIHYTAKTLWGTLHWNQNAQQAISMPNFGSNNGPTLLEEQRFTIETIEALKGRGHEVREMSMTSGLQAIHRVQGGYFGGADPRREGVVLGD